MWYTLTNKSKWGISEIQKVVNRDLGIGIQIGMNWKWGSFSVYSENELDIELEQKKYQNEVEIYCFDDCQIDHLDSGAEDFTFWNVDFTEQIEFDDGAQIIEKYQEEGWNALDDNGFGEELDPEIWIRGGISLEPSTSP